MRPAPIAVVAFVAATLGASGSLAVAKLAGWVDDNAPVQTVVLPPETVPGTSDPATATPLAANRFDPAGIFARTSPGVVTIYSIFPGGGRSQGSGFVVSDEGHVLTNSHVITNAGEGGDTIRGAERVYVVFADGDRLPASIVGWDLFDDTGLIAFDPKDHAVAPIPLGNSAAVVVGEPVAAIGSPFGNENSLAVGVVSAVSRSIPSLTSRYNVSNAIQIDAPINHGNSGGPLLDARGRVIGVNAQIRSDSGNAEGVGFAIPINSARRSMEQLIATGRVTYAYIGITTLDVTPAVARRYDLGAQRGALIEDVVEDAPADRAGLEGAKRRVDFNGSPVSLGGDLIVALAGEPVVRADDIARIVTERLRPGQLVTVTVVRGGTGAREAVRVRLVERPTNPQG
ncbi:MAG: trypsin-like peptidase domain-containing protein [Gaiellaceae bacterium MAG52_C11]|nr:trypsin-like peptidase domain-containing protein [Candidatus Gaiellasilicea maunaloa]